MTNPIATTLSGKADLYAGLRDLAARSPEIQLSDIYAALPAPVASRLQGVDQGLLRAVMQAGRGLPASVNETAVRAHLAKTSPAPLFRPEIAA